MLTVMDLAEVGPPEWGLAGPTQVSCSYLNTYVTHASFLVFSFFSSGLLLPSLSIRLFVLLLLLLLLFVFILVAAVLLLLLSLFLPSLPSFRPLPSLPSLPSVSLEGFFLGDGRRQ